MENQDGDHTVIVTVSDGELSDTETFTITVNEVNQVPTIVAVSDQLVVDGSLLTFALEASDTDFPANMLTYSLDAVSLGKGMQLDAGSGVFSWTTTLDDIGENEVTISVSDGIATVSEAMVVTVENQPRSVKATTASVNAYPNPAISQITFEGLSGPHRAVVYSIAGAYQFSQELTDGTLTIHQLQRDTYFVLVYDDEKTRFNARFIKE